MKQIFSTEDERNLRRALLTQILVIDQPAKTSKEFVHRQYAYIIGARLAGIAWGTIAASIKDECGLEIAVSTLKRYCTANRKLLTRPHIRRTIKQTLQEKQRLDVRSQLDPRFISALLQKPPETLSVPLAETVEALPLLVAKKPAKQARKLSTLAQIAEHEPSRRAQFKPIPPCLGIPLEVRDDGRVYYAETGHPFRGDLCAADVAELTHTGKLSARKHT